MASLIGYDVCMFPTENKFAKGLKPKPCGKVSFTICEVPAYNSQTKEHGFLRGKLCLPHAIQVAVDKFVDGMIIAQREKERKTKLLTQLQGLRRALSKATDKIVDIDIEKVDYLNALLRSGFAGFFDGMFVDRRDVPQAEKIHKNSFLDVGEPVDFVHVPLDERQAVVDGVKDIRSAHLLDAVDIV